MPLSKRAATVTVRRLIVRDSVEEQLLALSERKRQLAQQALAQGGALDSASTRLTADELVQFFR